MPGVDRRPLLIRGGRVLDPGRGLDRIGDLLIEEGVVRGVLSRGTPPPPGCRLLDASGMVVAPGFIDLHCHLREPGFEEKETIETGTRAAARGGFTTVCAMANTEPAIDNAELVQFVLRRGRETGGVRVLTLGAVTRGRKGETLAEMEEMAASGTVGFSDDGSPVGDARVMRNALAYSRRLGLPIVQHAEDAALTSGAAMHEGWVATRLGLKGWPAAAEDSVVARDIALVRLTGGRLHVAHVSTRGTVDLLRRAKEEGLPVTGEVTPHHLALTHEAVLGRSWDGAEGVMYDTNAKVNPPLRTQEECAALATAVKEGVIDAIATDHAPHTWQDKAVPFGEAAVGISGLETAAGLLLTLVSRGSLDLITVVERLTAGPARLLPERWRGLGTLKEGAPGDVVVLDLKREWTVRPEEFASKGKNTPLTGARFTGKVVATIVEGAVAYLDEGTKMEGA
ncbi:MAG: dihydroorotase [Chloroflexi bacterium]|nr:dihydroorotase [Chloroflexota bacterium]